MLVGTESCGVQGATLVEAVSYINHLCLTESAGHCRHHHLSIKNLTARHDSSSCLLIPNVIFLEQTWC